MRSYFNAGHIVEHDHLMLRVCTLVKLSEGHSTSRMCSAVPYLGWGFADWFWHLGSAAPAWSISCVQPAADLVLLSTGPFTAAILT